MGFLLTFPIQISGLSNAYHRWTAPVFVSSSLLDPFETNESNRLNCATFWNIFQCLKSIRRPVDFVAAVLSPLGDACFASYTNRTIFDRRNQEKNVLGANSCSACSVIRTWTIPIIISGRPSTSTAWNQFRMVWYIHLSVSQQPNDLIRRTKLPKTKVKSDQIYGASVSVVRLPIIVILTDCVSFYCVRCACSSGAADGRVLTTIVS